MEGEKPSREREKAGDGFEGRVERESEGRNCVGLVNII